MPAASLLARGERGYAALVMLSKPVAHRETITRWVPHNYAREVYLLSDWLWHNSPFVSVFERGWLEAALGHEEQRSHRVQVKHWWLQFRQLDSRDTNRPDVTQLVVATLPLHCCHLHEKTRLVKGLHWKLRWLNSSTVQCSNTSKKDIKVNNFYYILKFLFLS